MNSYRLYVAILTLVLLAVSIDSCGEAHQPNYQRVIVLKGTPYERGFQQGVAFHNEIRSLYTTLLGASLLPYLNREQPDMASALPIYNSEEYSNGRFSFQFLLDSAKSLEGYLPNPIIDELHGVADGADFPYDKILLMNMLLDSMFNMRAITFFIRKMQSPNVIRVEFLTKDGKPLVNDGIDNDSDGEVDEEDEGIIDPYEPLPWASMTEVPADGMIRFVLVDMAGLGKSYSDAEGVDPDSIRLQWNEDALYAGADGLTITQEQDESGKKLTYVTFQPSVAGSSFEEAAVVSIQIQAGDKAVVTEPPPVHAHLMRDERVVFTTKGYGKPAYEVPNKGCKDPRFKPPSIAFAVRNSATPDGKIRLAQHFAMLDSNTMHKHSAVFFCVPDKGKPFMYVGWTGVVWGFSGMNSYGVSYAINLSDTLNNGMTGELLANIFDLETIRMEANGTPAGILGRIILENAHTAKEAVELLKKRLPSFGWNFLIADANSDFRAVEMHQDILNDDDNFASFTVPAEDSLDLDEYGRAWGSVRDDDIRIASHWLVLTDDIDIDLFALIKVKPQRFWSSFYFRSMRAFYILGEQIERFYGNFDAQTMVDVLATDALVDHRDSMNAVVFEPETLHVYVSSGTVPATDGDFHLFDLGNPSSWKNGGIGAIHANAN